MVISTPHAPARRPHGERGSALIAAILMMIVVAALVASFSIIGQRAGERSADAARRVSNNATVQVAVTRVLYAYQNDLGSEQDYYTLDSADLQKAMRLAGTGARVVNPPSQFATTMGVWEHDTDSATPRLIKVTDPNARVPAVAVEEPTKLDTSACTGGLPASVCATGNVRSYWQIYRVVMPDITGNEPPNVVVIVRSWLGDPNLRQWSKASYARAELRPGRFADFQQISDGNVHFGDGARINGPVHSNGLGDGYAGAHTAPVSAVGNSSSWMYLEPGVSCVGSAQLSIRAGRIAGAARACNSTGANGQTISFLRSVNSIQAIIDAANSGRPGTRVFRITNQGQRGAEMERSAYDTSFTVRLNGSSMNVSYPSGQGLGNFPLGRVNAFEFDDDVKVSGSVSPNVRVTIAAQRLSGQSANIYIDGNLTKGDPLTSAIGLMAHGDVVLWQTPSNPCAVTKVQAAIVAATGGVTIPPQFTTSEWQTNAPNCRNQALTISGSIAGHRPPTLIWEWTNNTAAGYSGGRKYDWDEALKRNPPPFFPLTGTWQPFQVIEANQDCLFDTARQGDATCR